MSSQSVETLLADSIAAFSFLGEPLATRVVVPQDFRGGFVIEYPGDFRIQYLDCEFTVRRGEVELFGPGNHGGFAGNMFSRDNLPKYLSRIADELRAAVV